MAGYSGTPLLKKLGIKDGHRVLMRNAPTRLPEVLKDFSRARPNKDLDVVLLFARSCAEFETRFKELMKRIQADGMIWVMWPKKASGIETDLTEDVIREHALKTPFVDVKVCAIDDTWSGLKLVIRKEHRAAHRTLSN
jgi:Protein of unknown function (DUF3052)